LVTSVAISDVTADKVRGDVPDPIALGVDAIGKPWLSFRVPGVPIIPILGIGFCLVLMAGLPLDTWLRLVIWLAIGLVIHSCYGRHHSALRRH
jgi:hypothetical protein